ncbi:hypothetical protein CBER1_06713 [Cercospora berteroae]|uniref:Uncharacterized protein n=1 Tax=Cercospora berteroae TaxID=357750 RepID=A0A2S6CNF9_9PEZI|nr:hypothetical protein CBER1_06713 [Cercospora berteroae]
MLGLPRALMVFQGQHELLSVLENVLDDLTGGVAPSGSAQWSSLVTKGLHSAGRDISWNSYIHQPFTDPVAYSAENLYQRSTERLDMVKDELMLLQTDPAYTQEIIRMRRIALSNAAPGSRHKQQYEAVGGFLVKELLTRFEMWHTISSRCCELKKAMMCSNALHTPGGPSTPEVSMHIIALEASIEHWREQSSEDFEELRHFTNLGPRQVSPSHTDDHKDTDDMKEVLDPDNPLDRLKWQITGIRDSVGLKGRNLAGYASLFASIEREEAADKVMDQLTREYINDAMIMDEIYTHVTWIQQILDRKIELPWVKSGESCCILGDPKCRHSWLQYASGWQQRIGALAQSLMDAPWPKGRKDLSWLANATLTRSRLGKLWQGIFAEYGYAQEAGRSSPCGTYFMTSMTEFANDPKHLAQLEEDRVLCELESRSQSLIAEKNAEALIGYVAQSQWGSDGASNEKKPKSEEKTKLKAKPVQSSSSLAQGLGAMRLEDSHGDSTKLNSDDPGTTRSPISIPVQKENLVVFQKMCRAGTESTQGGTIRWQAFVQAMKDAGFNAEEAAGSAVSFRSSSLGGSICFHRPHPDPVLHPIMLYAMARRLTKWFGFTTETFVLRETEAAT